MENTNGDIIIYQTDDGLTKIDVKVQNETVWLSQQQMAELFNTTKQNISLHIKNIYDEEELDESSTVKEFLTVQNEGNRSVERNVKFYNLDMIISLGYRIKSIVATNFRKWAIERLKEKQIYSTNTEVCIIPMESNILSLKIAEELRKNKINVDIEMTNLKLKKVLSIVNEKNIPIVIIIDENEIKENKIIIKDMKNNFQICEDLNNYIETIQGILSIGKITYKILNPGGNKTALINGSEYTTNQKRLINRMIMEKYSQVEQVGFLSNKTNRLEMAGGEFCINATRCAVYEYSKRNRDEIEISVSGTNKKLLGSVFDENKVELRLDICKNIADLLVAKNDFIFVKLDGILIAILDEEKSEKYIKELKENEEMAKKEIKQLMLKNIQTNEKAIGIMLLEKVSNKLKINPVVWVKDIDTVFYETACGSGSLATAIYNYCETKKENIDLIQPSGYCINIKLDIKDKNIKSAIISGVVEEE